MREMINWELRNHSNLIIDSYASGEDCYKNYEKEPDILVSGTLEEGLSEKAKDNGFSACIIKDDNFLVSLSKRINSLGESINSVDDRRKGILKRINRAKSIYTLLSISAVIFVLLIISVLLIK